MINSPPLKAILLAAGLGKRLRPLTQFLPKCLMPIRGTPLLEYWLAKMYELKINDVLVNVHYRSCDVKSFLSRPRFKDWVVFKEEPELLGTAGTIRDNLDFIEDSPCLLVHADNWCCCSLKEFINYHRDKRAKDTVITMMTFTTQDPQNCGIVEIDKKGIVTNFFEKITNPPSDKANAAVYIIEPEVVSWIRDNKEIKDFSTEVIPKFLGKISTWHNNSIHRDIGTIGSLEKAQKDLKLSLPWKQNDKWQRDFTKHQIHKMIPGGL